MKQASVPFADFSSKYGIKATNTSVDTFVFKAALFVSLKERTSGSTSTIIKAIDKGKKATIARGSTSLTVGDVEQPEHNNIETEEEEL